MTALALTETTTDHLPTLVDRAAQHLASAKTAAEVLEARELARGAFEAGRIAERLAKAKGAHDEIVSAVYRAQAEALVIEAHAKSRLADEYDAARKRGDVAGEGRPKTIQGEDSLPTAAALGINSREIHEGREIAAALEADPEAGRRALAKSFAGHEAPTRAALRQEFRAITSGGTHVVSRRDRPEPDSKEGKTAAAVIAASREIANKLDVLDLDGVADALERISGGIATIRHAHTSLGQLLEVCDG